MIRNNSSEFSFFFLTLEQNIDCIVNKWKWCVEFEQQKAIEAIKWFIIQKFTHKNGRNDKSKYGCAPLDAFAQKKISCEWRIEGPRNNEAGHKI